MRKEFKLEVWKFLFILGMRCNNRYFAYSISDFSTVAQRALNTYRKQLFYLSIDEHEFLNIFTKPSSDEQILVWIDFTTLNLRYLKISSYMSEFSDYYEKFEKYYEKYAKMRRRIKYIMKLLK